MKVFVTGASGFVGENILQHLSAAGYSIRILARDPGSARIKKIAAHFNAEIHPGNVVNISSLSDGLVGVETVIHLAGIISETGKSTFENVHAGGTQNMVAVARQAGVKRFIHMSALGTRPNAAARYHQSKWAAEETVRASGLAYTIFRPSIIYGPDDHFVNLFVKISRCSPVLPVIGDGQPKLQPAPVSDVAKCFVNALTELKSIGQTIDLCGPESLTFEQVVDTILAVTHRRRWKIHIPIGVADLQAALLETICKLLRRPAPLTRDQVLMLQEDNVGNPQFADELFNLQPVPFADGIKKYLSPINSVKFNFWSV